MPATAHTSNLQDRLLDLQGSVRTAHEAIQALASLAEDLGQRRTENRLRREAERLLATVFALIVVGRFSNGKSTLLNALIGRLARLLPGLPEGEAPLPMAVHPTTATLTRICHAEEPYVKALHFDGSEKRWNWAEFLGESTVRADEAANVAFFDPIRAFEVGLPSDLLKSGIMFLDSPGTEDDSRRTEVTLQAVEESDVAILVFRHDLLRTMTESELYQEVVSRQKTRAFLVVNMFNGKELDERGEPEDAKLRAFAWNKLVRDLKGGPAYSGEEFASYDVFFMDCQKALEGRLNTDDRKVEESGLGRFERRLGEFLSTDRHLVHLEKFVRRGETLAARMGQRIDQQQAALELEQVQLAEAATEIQAQLTDIRTIRDGLSEAFGRCLPQCQRAVQVGFMELIVNLKAQVPGTLEKEPLPSVQSFGDAMNYVWNEKDLCGEALAICNRTISRSLYTWRTNPPDRPGVQQHLAPILEGLFDAIQSDFRRMERMYASVHSRLSGWRADALPNHTEEDTERTRCRRTLIDPAEIVRGGVLDDELRHMSDLLASLPGRIAAAVTVEGTGFSIARLWTYWPLIADKLGPPGRIVAVLFGLDKRVKKLVSERVLERLQSVPEKMKTVINRETESVFTALQAEVMDELLAVIEDEEANINAILNRTTADHARKEQERAALAASRREIVCQRQALREVLVKASLLS